MRSPHRIIFLQLLWLWHLFYTSIVLYFCRFCPPTPHGEPWPLAPRFRRDGGGTPRLAATDWTADHSRGRGAPGATARRFSSWARESRRWGWWWMFAAAFIFLVSGCWDLLDLSWFIRWLLWWRWEWILKGYLFDSNSNHGLFAWNPHVFWGMFFPMIRSLQTHTEWANPEAVSGREVGAICEAVRFLVLMIFFLPICFELIWYIFPLVNPPLGQSTSGFVSPKRPSANPRCTRPAQWFVSHILAASAEERLGHWAALLGCRICVWPLKTPHVIKPLNNLDQLRVM